MGPRKNSLGNRWDDARYGSLEVISSDQTTATSRRPSSTRDTRIDATIRRGRKKGGCRLKCLCTARPTMYACPPAPVPCCFSGNPHEPITKDNI
jgi:hypothetical protein